MLMQQNGMHPTSALQGTFHEPASAKLFIGGLSYDTTDASLARYFGQFGDVASAIVLRDPVTSHSRGFGFVTFIDEQSAQRVLAVSRNHIVDGRKVEAKIAVPKSQTAPRKMMPNGMMNGMQYGGYGMGMPMNLGLGLNDQYAMPGYGNMGYDMPMYSSSLAANGEIYSSMQNFADPQFGMEYEGQPLGLESNGSSRLSPHGQSPRFAERLASIQSIGSKNDQNVPSDEDEASVPGAPNIRRPTYPQLDSLHVSPTRLRKFSMPPSKLKALNGEIEQLSNQFSDMDFNGDDTEFSPKRVYVTGLSPDTTSDKLKVVFSSFGSVKSAEISKDQRTGKSKGYGFIVFQDVSAVDDLVDYEKMHGKLLVDEKEVTLRRFGETNSIHENEFLGSPMARSNSLHISSREMFSGLDDFDRPAKIPMMRSHSIAQTMFVHPAFEDDDIPEINFGPNALLKDDKMRSLSFTSAAVPSLQRMHSESHRRGSIAVPNDRSVFNDANLGYDRSPLNSPHHLEN